jgi:hypothetical protein
MDRFEARDVWDAETFLSTRRVDHFAVFEMEGASFSASVWLKSPDVARLRDWLTQWLEENQ